MAKTNKLLRLFMGKHLIELARATDADPEKIMEAAESMNDDAETPNNTQLNEFKSEDKRGRDGELPEALKENQFKPKGEDARKAAHDALDAILDRTNGYEEGVPTVDKRKAKDTRAKDADIEELKSLLNEFLSEEEKEPEHAADRRAKDRRSKDDEDIEDADPTDLEEVLAGEAEDEEPCPDCGEAHDTEECPGEELTESGEEVIDNEGGSPDPDDDDDQEDVEARDRRKAKDRARAADGASAVLRMLRPIVAKSTDKSVHNAFNRALDSVKKSSRTSTGGYAAFAGSARARDNAPRNPNPDRVRAGDASKSDPIAKMQEFYNSAHKGGK